MLKTTKTRVGGAVIAGAVAIVLLAGCSAAGGVDAPATLGQGASAPSPSASATPDSDATVASVSPSTGSLVSGETATITGTALTGVDRVTFDDQDADDVTVVDSRTITVVVPAAVDYQPSTGAVVAYKGATKVPGATLEYAWSARTGVDREMQYAFAHWKASTYNAAYADFNSVGGDCQNFVSQSLLAGGLATSDDWFYGSASSHSESWGYAPAFNELLDDTPSLGFTRLASTQRSQLAVGDLAYFDWNGNGVPDHVMIVSRVSTVAGRVTISLVGHNLDFDYRDLDTAITKDHPGATVWFYKVPDSMKQS